MDTHEIKKKRRMIVDISKKSVKKIRELIVFTAFLVVALWKFNVVLDVLKAIWGIVFPFVLGGAIAFVTNVPMSFLEKTIFKNVKKENKEIRFKGLVDGNIEDICNKYFDLDRDYEKIKKEKDTNREISTALREIRQALKVL